MSGPVKVKREEAVVRVVLSRSEARNALNLSMCHGLTEAFRAIDRNHDIRVVIVEGEGPVFCAGADLKERKGRDAAWIRQRRLASFEAYSMIERCTRPVIALVQGPTVGSGGEIAMSCDFIVAANDASFRFPEAHWGTVGATQRLQRVVGVSRAKELLYTGREMPAEEAYALGMVARLVEPSKLSEEGMLTALKIAEAPPLSIALTKQSVDLGSRTDLDSGIRIELAAIERVLADNGWKNGVDRFLQNVGNGAADAS
ncbi:enoyl-CoA hydratase/isomerase family protein [Mesorhizobium sp. BAC0120]|uniref:enoyl-CoA hydratase/isomerase family protein n=1 Tax=Mesorhizobium sp. BAC0120 TaxID=3090670 RepID=UPI00298CAEEF|nr:enoyl-CoA hydratase/isomerase family protein [Mesorhizobium sp. BAC0120]MDW6023278.1 enoyl-CoA hydratase/isomerase family protein [Mesorhizobium sp. BAC0120]